MRIATGFLAIAVALSAAAQPKPIDAMLRGVRQMLEAGRAAEALAVLDAADTSGAGKRDRARICFYQARAYEDLGDEQKAIAAYTRATQIEPAYGAALNNLAQLLARGGDSTRAAALLKSAVALADDPYRVLYLNNYAVAAEKSGDVAAARNAYASLAAAQPDNVDAQLSSIRLLGDPRRMAEQLVKLSNRGEAGAAQSLALDLLRKPYDAQGKRALLSVVAGTLACQHLDASRAVSRLTPLGDDPQLRDGVGELLLLYRGNVDPSQYRWWRAPRDERFAALVRDLGAASGGAKAEGYFKLALEYAEGRDPDAFIELADLYYAQKRTADLDELARRYGGPMFDAKIDTIASGDTAAEYRFHVALGTIYAYLQRWGSENDPASAIFQLAQAQRAGIVQTQSQRTWTPKIPADPKVVDLLATGYAKTNLGGRAVALRIEQAEAFLDDRRKTAAKIVLKPVDRNAIAEPALRRRYDDLIERLKKPMTYETSISFPDTVEVSLKSAEPTSVKMSPELGRQITNLLRDYVLADSDRGRDGAEDALRKLGASGLNPTNMSRSAGELVVSLEGKTVRYLYVVKATTGQ
jgi:tetratricopeptide (TPR) repeat protein